MDIQEFASLPNLCPNLCCLELALQTHMLALRYVNPLLVFSSLEELTVECLSSGHLSQERTNIDAVAYRIAMDLRKVSMCRSPDNGKIITNSPANAIAPLFASH